MWLTWKALIVPCHGMLSEVDRVSSWLARPSLIQAHCKSMLEQKRHLYHWVIENSWVELLTLQHNFLWMLLIVYHCFVLQSPLMLARGNKCGTGGDTPPSSPPPLSPGSSWCFPEGINNHLQGTLITKRATYVTLSRAPESAHLLTYVRRVFWQPLHAD